MTTMMEQIIDNIGYYGPVILFALGFYALLERKPFYTAFVFGNISNSLLNMVLKNIIREPRPIEEEGDYGFPSGHAQSVFFSLVFLFLAKGPAVFIYIMACISVLTLYQRWKYKKHSVKQLVAGSIIGSLYAVFIIYLTDQYLLSKNYLVKESDVIQI
jgi:membrane-associated phospholipid phosphatase